MKIIMKRGDTCSPNLTISKALYSPGQIVSFTAKKEYDNDPTNSKAVINKSYSDESIISQDENKVIYRCTISPEDTQNIEIPLKRGRGALKLIGEYQIKDSNGIVRTLPSGNKFINVVIYPDIKMGD